MLCLRCVTSALLLVCGVAFSATLEPLSLDEMVQQSTLIVRAKAGHSHSERRGALIYTSVELEVLEQWKGGQTPRVQVSLPGGQTGLLSQHFDGVPVLTPGQEFVAFLWTGPSGRTQILGMSQGFFSVSRDSQGHILVHRKPTSDLMLSRDSATPAPYTAIEMPLDALVAKIRSVLAAGVSSQ